MSVSRDFTKSVFALLREGLASLGFEKRRPRIFSRLVSEDVLGLIGLNAAAGGRDPGVLEINPVIGVRNQRVERLVAELLEEPFDDLNPFSASANIGYLSPTAKYQPFLFSETEAPDKLVGELSEAIKANGIPFINANASLETLVQTMRSSRFAIQFVAVYRIPVALHILGKYAEVDNFLDNELKKIGSATDPAAERFRRFARRLQDRNRARHR